MAQSSLPWDPSFAYHWAVNQVLEIIFWLTKLLPLLQPPILLVLVQTRVQQRLAAYVWYDGNVEIPLVFVLLNFIYVYMCV